MGRSQIRMALRSKSEAPRQALAESPRQFPGEQMDDVVIENVRMFRAELMDEDDLWLACYFGESEDQSTWERVSFQVRVEGPELVFEVTETPESGYTDLDSGEPGELSV